MTRRSPRIVIIVNREHVPLAAHYERPPIGPEYRLVDTLQGLSPSVSLRVFTEWEGEGT